MHTRWNLLLSGFLYIFCDFYSQWRIEKGGDNKTLKTTVLAFATIMLASLFFVNSTTSISSRDLGIYDPWCDIDDDGDIDIFDVVKLASKYGTTGTPINKTELILELQARVEALENQSGWLPAPAYDSGWLDFPVGNHLYIHHNLSTSNLFVHLVGRSVNRTHQMFLAREMWRKTLDRAEEYGVYWLTDEANPLNAIELQRGGDDVNSTINWNEIHVQIWTIAQP